MLESTLKPHPDIFPRSSGRKYRVSRNTVKKQIYPPSMEAKFKPAIEAAIELCIEGLYDQAHATCDGYINFVDAVESKSAGWDSRSNLQLSRTKKGNHLDIRWVGIKWYGQKNKRTSLRVTLKMHSEKLSYGPDQIKPYAK